MYKFPIGIMMESLREDDKTAIASASKWVLNAYSFMQQGGDHASENMSSKKRTS